MRLATGTLIALIFVGFQALAQQANKEKTQREAQSVVSDMNRQLADSQQHIDQLSLATRKMLQQYREILQQKDYQQYYNYQLRQQKDAQEQEIAALQKQLQELDLIEVAMMPLMQSMLLALEEFIALDMPFKRDTRLAGLQKLRSRINGSALNMPDKYRLLMEAWQIEYDYGRTVETWRGDLVSESEAAADADMAVNYLRVGRVAWYYMTLDETRLAMWDKESRRWQELPADFNADLKRAMQIASEQIAPELLPLPLNKAQLASAEKPFAEKEPVERTR